MFLSWLSGLVVVESLDPLEDVGLSPMPGAFRDVKRLRKATVWGICFLPDGAYADAEHGCDFFV